MHNCQDISIAGKQKGLFNEDGTKTRSGLFFDALRIIEETKPRYAIAENVKALTSKRFKSEFEIVLKSLDEVGYNNYYQVLDAKDYGIPQHRERVFIVSIRKDIDNGKFNFPEPLELKLRLKDMLEDEVDEKYYLSEKQVNSIKTSTYTQNARRIQEKDYCDTLCARDWKDPKCIKVEPKRIRKLTPKECWRLMGFTDEDFEKAQKINSNTQLYKQAGNSVCVNVIEELYKNLLN